MIFAPDKDNFDIFNLRNSWALNTPLHKNPKKKVPDPYIKTIFYFALIFK